MITVAALQLRRRVVEAAQRRHRPRRLPAATIPAGVITTYTRGLLDLNRELDDALEAELTAAGIPVRLNAKATKTDPVVTMSASQAAHIHSRLDALVHQLLHGRSLLQVLATVAQRTDTQSRAQWAAQVKAALGVDLTGDPNMAARIEHFRVVNVQLIRSMLHEKVARVHRALAETGSGTRVEVIQKRIEQETGATRARAALIARDQVLSLNAAVTEDRHKAAGVDSYIWRTSRDERVREAHRDLDGTRHRYDDPPVADERGTRANPGVLYQCRCTAEPVIPGLE